MTADLHCHTKLSDGTMGIEDLIVLAMKRGVTTISITDHDCVVGTVRAQNLAKRHGIRVIPGVEISCTHRETGKRVHILCYDAEKPERLANICHLNSQARKKAGRVMTVRVADRYPIVPEFVAKTAMVSTNVYKQHIMQVLMDCGFTNSVYGEVFDELFSKKSENNILVNTVYATPKDAIEAVHDAGGIAVLAHPGLSDCFDLLDEMTELGIDGVEVWHPYNSEEQQQRLKDYAKQHGLLMTGGSDFHGAYNTKVVSPGDYTTPQENLDELLAYKAKQRRKQRKLEKAAAVAEN